MLKILTTFADKRVFLLGERGWSLSDDSWLGSWKTLAKYYIRRAESHELFIEGDVRWIVAKRRPRLVRILRASLSHRSWGRGRGGRRHHHSLINRSCTRDSVRLNYNINRANEQQPADFTFLLFAPLKRFKFRPHAAYYSSRVDENPFRSGTRKSGAKVWQDFVSFPRTEIDRLVSRSEIQRFYTLEKRRVIASRVIFISFHLLLRVGKSF